MAPAEASAMKRFKNILCVVEAARPCAPMLQRAVGLAQSNQAELTVVDVVPRISAGIGMPEGGPISTELQAALVAEHRTRLDELLAPYRQQTAIQTRVLTGMPFLELIRAVLRDGYDLVIKAPEDPSWLDRLLGSDDMHLLRKCPCPVWLVKCGAPKAYRRILTALDLADDYPPEERQARQALNLQLLQMAASLALAEFAELHVAHVWEAIGEGIMRSAFVSAPEERITAYVSGVRRQHEASLRTLLDQAQATLGPEGLQFLKPQQHLVRGSASREIPALAKRLDADLIVMGTVGRSGIAGFFMGNTAETVLYQIDCSVLAVKPAGFVSPVSVED
jgi:nucleotide-binding universal stress UspA family protein